jgi:transposase-like protein
MRKHYTSQQKIQIVLEVLKEEKTVPQIASANGVHPNQIYRWKTQVLKGLPGLLDHENKAEQEKQATQEQQIQELYAEIGHLTTQLSWLKKKSGIDPNER